MNYKFDGSKVFFTPVSFQQVKRIIENQAGQFNKKINDKED